MEIFIEKDTEGNRFFRQLRVPLGAGTSTTIRVVDTEADEVANKLMNIDLGPSINAIEGSGRVFASEYDLRVAVVEHAANQIIKEGQAKRMSEAPAYYPDSMSA